MKIALIRCRTSCGPRETNVTGMYPPLGLAYVGAVLQREGYDVAVVDAEAQRLSIDAMLDAIPTDAAMMESSANHCINVRCSPRNSMPDNAARPGSRLISVPKVRVGRRVNAIISSE